MLENNNPPYILYIYSTTHRGTTIKSINVKSLRQVIEVLCFMAMLFFLFNSNSERYGTTHDAHKIIL
jgi:hypothetical protein